ncbi:MAG: rRNA pseudouridine synthase [Tibeticola sp.]
MNAPTPPPPASEGERLAKRVAALRGCSRAEAERLIEGGWVWVDGEVVTLPQHRVHGNERIDIAPDARAASLRPATLLWHRRSGETAASPPADARWSADPSRERLLPRHLRALQTPLPLPAGAAGLIVLTQDARIAQRLGDERALPQQEWQLDFDGMLDDTRVDALQRATGAACKLSVGSRSATRTRLRAVGHAPALGERLAEACADLGLPAVAAKRLRIGRIALAVLPEGQWRFLQPFERF